MPYIIHGFDDGKTDVGNYSEGVKEGARDDEEVEEEVISSDACLELGEIAGRFIRDWVKEASAWGREGRVAMGRRGGASGGASGDGPSDHSVSNSNDGADDSQHQQQEQQEQQQHQQQSAHGSAQGQNPPHVERRGRKRNADYDPHSVQRADSPSQSGDGAISNSGESGQGEHWDTSQLGDNEYDSLSNVTLETFVQPLCHDGEYYGRMKNILKAKRVLDRVKTSSADIPLPPTQYNNLTKKLGSTSA